MTNRKKLVVAVAAVVAIAGVALAARAVLRKVRYPTDPASVEKVERLAAHVREHYATHNACPDLGTLEKYSVSVTGLGLCPGGGVPDHPCIGYYDMPTGLHDCLLLYPLQMDGYHTYLVMQDRWFAPDQWHDFLVEFHGKDRD